MQKLPTTRSCRKRSVLVMLLGLMTAGFVLVVGLVAVAAFTVYQAGKVLATVAVSAIEGIAVLASIIVTLATFVTLVIAGMVLQTPLMLTPFGPAAEVLRFGLRVWIAREGL